MNGKVIIACIGLATGVSMKSPGEDLCEVDEAESFLCSPENPTGRRGGGNAIVNAKNRPFVTVRPGETAVLLDGDGPGRIEQMWFGGAIDRDLVLRMYWDGEREPSVCVPLPFFFGGPNFNPADRFDPEARTAALSRLQTTEGRYPCYASALLTVSPAFGCNSYFHMPFRAHARITLENISKDKSFDSFYAITGSRGDQSEKAGYFHARFSESHPVRNGEAHVALDLKCGRGRYVGMTFAVELPPSSRYKCWCEGEPRIYLDGELTPSLHYTGLEDYFCGSYNFGRDNLLHRYQPFRGLYAGMYAMFGGDIPSRFQMYRFHVADPIRFRNGIRITLDDMQLNGDKPVARSDGYMTTCYWYQAR